MDAKFILPMWEYTRFADLFKHSPREAFEYRQRVLGDPIPFEHLTDEEKALLPKEEIIETPTESDGKYDIDSLKKILKDNKVRFYHSATLEQLVEKCISLKLI